MKKKMILRKIAMLLVGMLVLFGSFPFHATAEDDLIEVTYLDGEEEVTRMVHEVRESMDTAGTRLQMKDLDTIMRSSSLAMST